MSRQLTLDEVRAILAKVDAAEASGELTDENMSDYGYVETEGGLWELPWPLEILRRL